MCFLNICWCLNSVIWLDSRRIGVFTQRCAVKSVPESVDAVFKVSSYLITSKPIEKKFQTSNYCDVVTPKTPPTKLQLIYFQR